MSVKKLSTCDHATLSHAVNKSHSRDRETQQKNLFSKQIHHNISTYMIALLRDAVNSNIMQW